MLAPAVACRPTHRQRQPDHPSILAHLLFCIIGASGAPAMILRWHERFENAVAGRRPRGLRCRPADRQLPVSAARGAGRPGPHRAVRPGQDAAAQAARDRGAAGRPTWPAAPGVRKAEVAGGGLREPVPGPGRLRARAARPRCTARLCRAPVPGQRDRRAHQHQPQQGRPHRPPAQRRPGRHLRARAAQPRAPRSACRTTSTTPACRSRTWWWASCTSSSKTLAEVGALAGQRFDYYCWDLYARVGDFYAADPAQQGAAGGDAARHRAGRERDRRAGRATWPRASWTATWPTMERLGIRYDLLAHESDILRLHFWDRAFELLKESGAIRLETEGKKAGCWVLWRMESARRKRRRQDHRALERHRHLHRQGHRLPALEAGPARPRLPLPPPSHVPGRPRALDDDQRRGRAGRAGVRPRARGLQRDRRRPVLPAAGGEGGRGRARPRGGGGGQPPPGLREGRALARHRARARLRRVRGRGRGEGVRPQGPGRQGRRPHRRAGDQGAGGDRGPRSRGRARRRARRRRPRTRSPSARCATSCSSSAAPRSSPSTWRRRWPSPARPGPTSRTAWCARANIFAKLEARGPRRGGACWRGRARSTSTPFLDGEEGDEVWSLLVLMARSEEVAEQAVRVGGGGAAGQARLRHRPGLPLLLPEAALLACSTRRARTCAPSACCVVDAFLRQMRRSHRPAGHPRPGADVSAAPHRDHGRARHAEPARSTGSAQDYVRSVERAGGAAGGPGPRPSRGTRPGSPGPPGRPPALGGRRHRSRSSTARSRHPTVAGVARERDEFELALAREALRAGPAAPGYLPGPSGVKRCHRRNTGPGHPVSEVTGDVNHDPDVERWEAVHDVRILPGHASSGDPGTRRGGGEQLPPSGGRDAGAGAGRLGPLPGDGVVEGIEAPDRRFVVGVQWHPEGFWRAGGRLPRPLRGPGGGRAGMTATVTLALLLAGYQGPGGYRGRADRGSAGSSRFDEALKKARASRKPIMVDFWADWCGWCHRLDQTTYVDPAVVKMAGDDFVAVKVNTEGAAKEIEVARAVRRVHAAHHRLPLAFGPAAAAPERLPGAGPVPAHHGDGARGGGPHRRAGRPRWTAIPRTRPPCIPWASTCSSRMPTARAPSCSSAPCASTPRGRSTSANRPASCWAPS